MDSECADCVRKNGDCGGHWKPRVRPYNQATRSKVTLDTYDRFADMQSAYDRDAYDPGQ